REVVELFRACADRAKKFGFYINHFSLQDNHGHLIAEARDNKALGNGMRSLGCSLGKAIRRRAHELGGSRKVGSVFSDRYHLEVIKNPQQMKNTLQYVLLNTSKHSKLIAHIDRYSSAAEFTQWRELLGAQFFGLIEGQVEDLERNSRRYARK